MRKIIINKHIVADPDICHGKPTFKNTRIMVWQILELLEAGESLKDIYSAYPTLPKGAVEAALHYAAEKVKGINYVPFDKGKVLQAQVFA